MYLPQAVYFNEHGNPRIASVRRSLKVLCHHYFRPYCIMVANMTHWKQGTQGKQKKNIIEGTILMANIIYGCRNIFGWSYSSKAGHLYYPQVLGFEVSLLLYEMQEMGYCVWAVFWNPACLPWLLWLTCTVTICVFGLSYIQHNLQAISPGTFAYECTHTVVFWGACAITDVCIITKTLCMFCSRSPECVVWWLVTTMLTALWFMCFGNSLP